MTKPMTKFLDKVNRVGDICIKISAAAMIAAFLFRLLGSENIAKFMCNTAMVGIGTMLITTVILFIWVVITVIKDRKSDSDSNTDHK